MSLPPPSASIWSCPSFSLGFRFRFFPYANMIPLVAGAWIVYLIVVACFIVFSIGFTRYYQDKRESELFATIVTIAGLSLIFATLALLPVDIFLFTSTVDLSTGLKKDWATPDVVGWITTLLRLVYYVCYGSIALFSFAIIPFAYFYFEEYDENQPTNQRVVSALRYTSFFVTINIVLIIIGLFLTPSGESKKIDLDWFKRLITESNGEKALAFVIAVLILLGLVIFICYTAPGLSLLPFGLIKGRTKLEEENADLSVQIAVCREKQRAITLKYAHSTSDITTKDRKLLEYLEMQEKILLQRQRTVDEGQRSCWQTVLRFLRPVEILTGLLLLVLSFVIIGSIFLTSIDKITNSICGRHCGYILSNPAIFNPINFIFIKLSKYFPLDYVFMDLVIIYFFLGTITGIIRLGVRFMWVTLFKIRAASTPPQGLLFATIILMLSLLALNFSLATVVAPGYAHFGSQVFCNHTIGDVRDCKDYPQLILPCSFDGPIEICTPTVASTLIDGVTVNTPFLGVIFYYAQWAFVGVFLISFIIALFRTPRGQADDEIEDFIEREEEQRLLGNERRSITPRGSQSSLGRTVRPRDSRASLREDEGGIRPKASKSSLAEAARKSGSSSHDDVV